MGASSIEWTKKVWNPITGCTKVSPGCKFCYAETFAERWRGIKGHPFEQGFDLKLWPARLEIPLQWKKPTKIFVNSMSDLFHRDVPIEFIDKVFATMARAPHHTFQILTKRADLMRDYMKSRYYFPLTSGGTIGVPKNVWLGVSVEDQASADARIPLLLDTPAAVRWVSAEPLLERVDLFVPAFNGSESFSAMGGLNWVVVGGESGAHARPFNLTWAANIVNACRVAGVPVFVKQLGRRPFRNLPEDDGRGVYKIRTELVKLKDKKGGDMAEWADPMLRVREFPR